MSTEIVCEAALPFGLLELNAAGQSFTTILIKKSFRLFQPQTLLGATSSLTFRPSHTSKNSKIVLTFSARTESQPTPFLSPSNLSTAALKQKFCWRTSASNQPSATQS